MRIHVVGLGSVGTLFAAHLRNSLPATTPIALLHKNQSRLTAFVQNGSQLRITTERGSSLRAADFHSEVAEAAPDNELIDPQEWMISKQSTLAPNLLHKMIDKENYIRSGRLGIAPREDIESLIVAVKAHQTEETIRNLLPRISPNGTIVLLQNGLGIYEMLIEKFFNDPVRRPHFILCSNTHGAVLREPFHVRHTGRGDIAFGIVPNEHEDFEQDGQDLNVDNITTEDSPNYTRSASLRETVAALARIKGLGVSWKPMTDVHIAMLKKIVVNACINPMTALLGCRNGIVSRHESGKTMISNICSEAAALFTAQYVHEAEQLQRENPTQDFTYERVPGSLSKESLYNDCLRVAKNTRLNTSSMLQDVNQGRATEVEFINGYLCRQGEALGVPMPYTKSLYDLMTLKTRFMLDPPT